MSTNKTKNLKLHSWEPTDRFTREEFNDNWAGIDAAWGQLDGRILAEVEARSAEAASRAAADTTLQKNIDAEATNRKNADTAIQAMFEGRPKMVVGTYVGSISPGASAERTIEIGFRPKVLFIRALDTYSSALTQCRFAMAVDGYNTKVKVVSDIRIYDTYFTVQTHPNGPRLHESGVTYLYVAFA